MALPCWLALRAGEKMTTCGAAGRVSAKPLKPAPKTGARRAAATAHAAQPPDAAAHARSAPATRLALENGVRHAAHGANGAGRVVALQRARRSHAAAQRKRHGDVRSS